MNSMRFASLQIKIAKWVDEYFGRLLIALLRGLRFRGPAALPLESPQKILLIKFWGMGSIILLEPALRLLRERYPHARIEFLTLTQNRELFALLQPIARVHTLDFARPLRFLLCAVQVCAQLRRQNFDIILDAEFFANFSALLARLAAPRKLLGFSRAQGYKRYLLDATIPFHDHEHAAQNFLRLVAAATNTPIPRFDHRVFPRVSLPQRAPIGENYVVVNVNASALALERRWPPQHFAQLAKWLLQRYESKLILIGDKAERAYTQQIAEAIAAPMRVRNLAGTMHLRELAEVIDHAALFISNDSGPLHLAAALQKPVVGFYGPETPQRFGALCEQRLIFYLGLACSPCMSVDNAKSVHCTNHLRCMRELQVAQVVPVLERFIAQHALLPLREMKNEETILSPAGVFPYAD